MLSKLSYRILRFWLIMPDLTDLTMSNKPFFKSNVYCKKYFLIRYQIPINFETAFKRPIAGASAKHALQRAYIIKQSIKSVSM